MVSEHVHYNSSLQKRKCSLCGKEFYTTLGNDYAYKIKTARSTATARSMVTVGFGPLV